MAFYSVWFVGDGGGWEGLTPTG